ncbi:MAG: glycosyltransferase family 39 protein [Nocardiopsaceae bacterium]|nr:glycosyltransferase family 39 protein [Nocardiopsaceae bacterium]
MNATRGTASPDTVPIRIPAQPGPPEAERGPARRRRRLARAAGAYWRSVALLVPVLAVAGAVTGWNLQGWPGRADDDEGTYVAEAWAMLTEHHLSHYTYWYDHPPLGWGQIALFGWVTDGFHRVSSEVMLGREFMWCLTLAGCTALFVTCRRLGLRRVTAAAAATLFAVSPLALWYHRMVSLDNIAVVWLLAALAIAASRRRSLGAAFWSAVALAIGILSKETTVILAPVVVCVLWQHTRRQTRWWNLGIFGVTLSLLLAGYPLFAALRNELLPGRGHVSLLWSLWWQFIARAGSGSPLTASSASHWLLNLWLELDPWLLGAGLALAAPALAVRRLRPVAFALLIQVLVPMKGGYLPYFYVTAMLPFAAALVAGAGEALWLWFAGPRTRWIGRAVVAACALAFAAGVAPQWWGELSAQARLDRDTASLAATRWVERNVPPRAVVVVDDYIWPDLKLRGLNPLWMWKVDGDPRVSAVDLEHGWRSIGYVVVTPQAAELLSQMPVLNAAVEHSVVLANFGQGVTVRQVLSGPVAPEATAAALQPPPPEPGPPTRVRSPLIGR